MNLFLQANAEGGIAGFLPLIAILAVMYFFFTSSNEAPERRDQVPQRTR